MRELPIKRYRWLKAVMVIIIIGLIAVSLPVFRYVKDNDEAVANLANPTLDLPLSIYASNGQMLQSFSREEGYREPILLSQMPPQLINAVMATEDKEFLEHNGVKLSSLFRAAIASIKSGHLQQGGSTISMQVAKVYFLSQEKTFARKAKQIILAYMIDARFTKDQILELYLNKIFFGHNAYGVQAAAKTYYGKPAADLTLAESAMLAGMIHQPSRANPVGRHASSALKRRNNVLKKMRDDGYITDEEYTQAIADKPSTKLADTIKKEARIANSVTAMARSDILKQYCKGQSALKDCPITNGMKVYTTIDVDLQNKANEAVQTKIDQYNIRQKNKPGNGPQAALISINPNTGAILSLVGNVDFGSQQLFNYATQANRQMGSSIKPFIYAAALNLTNKQWSNTIIDQPFIVKHIPIPDKKLYWAPHNHDETFTRKEMTLEKALATSNNVVTVQLLSELFEERGRDETRTYLRKFNLPVPDGFLGLSLALGAMEVTPLQMTQAYSVFANNGQMITPYYITKITDEKGKTLYTAPPAAETPVMSKDAAEEMLMGLKAVFSKGTAFAKPQNNDNLQGAILAGKTGTTNKQQDAWFTGFNLSPDTIIPSSPHILTTVWVGYSNQNHKIAARSLNEYAAQLALPLWRDYMRQVLPGANITETTTPVPIIIAQPRQESAETAEEENTDGTTVSEPSETDQQTEPTYDDDTDTPPDDSEQSTEEDPNDQDNSPHEDNGDDTEQSEEN